MRHSRRITTPCLDTRVDQCQVAPHRFTWMPVPGQPWTDRDDTPGQAGMRVREWLKKVEYQAGDVVWIVCGGEYARAMISGVFVSYDRYDDRRPMFRVHRETTKGGWSKNWYYAYPGQIQRGYLRATIAGQADAHDLIGNMEP